MCAQSSSNTGGMDGAARGSAKPSRLLAAHPDLVDRLYSEVSASPWSVSRQRFEDALERSAAKRFASCNRDEQVSRAKLEEFLGALHLQDLSLAAACASGQPAAWEFFVITYRGYLRAAAAAILHCKTDSVAAQDLADSLFTDLYGIATSASGKSEDRSLFRYFHGRSSLKTWLRAVLAQRHIDSIRASRRFVEIEDQSTSTRSDEVPFRERVTPIDSASAFPNPAHDSSPDPHRSRYLALFSDALHKAFKALEPQDLRRLRFYYADQQTLAHIGRELGEHESSVSRNLDRIRRELRVSVESALRSGQFQSQNGTYPQPALSDEQIALCFEYAAEDAPLNFDQVFPTTPASAPATTTAAATTPAAAVNKPQPPQPERQDS
jgi:RNA polymerase sigma factor (sigma-70 family)